MNNPIPSDPLAIAAQTAESKRKKINIEATPSRSRTRTNNPKRNRRALTTLTTLRRKHFIKGITPPTPKAATTPLIIRIRHQSILVKKRSRSRRSLIPLLTRLTRQPRQTSEPATTAAALGAHPSHSRALDFAPLALDIDPRFPGP